METNPNDDMVISYQVMRKAVGWLGLLLPFILLFGNYIINHLNILNNAWFVVVDSDCVYPYASVGSFKSSISHYYYTTMGVIFTGVLCAVALFMFCYKGHPLRKGDKGLSDSFVTNIAALFALGVVIFPTSSDSCITDNTHSFLSSRNTGYVHFTFAALFFISLAYMCLVNFRRTSQPNITGKGGEYSLYLFCGITMLACLLIIFVYVKYFQSALNGAGRRPVVFIFETIALVAFGISWLTKGDVDFMYLPKSLGLMK